MVQVPDHWKTELLDSLDHFIHKKIYIQKRSILANGRDHWKTEQDGGHLVFGPLENRTSKHLVFQFVWYSYDQFSTVTL